MSVDFEKFLNWAERRFDDVVVQGNEIKINSIFCEDHKHHLWCNPTGGKKEHPNGVFRCWKSDAKGSLVSLIMMVDGISFQEALEILGGEDISLAELERQVDEMFSEKNEISNPVSSHLSLPDGTYLIESLPDTDYFRVQSEVYLLNRKLDPTGLYVCTKGNYRNRIVIPYYDRTGNLIYFNARDLSGKSPIKYMGPPKECGIGKADVLYFEKWPDKNKEVYLTEGEFDSRVFRSIGFESGAFGGKALSEIQITYLKDMQVKPILCLDGDPPGRSALPKIADLLESQGVTPIKFAFPPKSCKDWNELLQKTNSKTMKTYIKNSVKIYGTDRTLISEIDSL